MNRHSQNILIVSRDAAFCEACKKELRDAGGEVRAETAASLEEATAIAQSNSPDVILLDETAVIRTAEDPAEGTRDLERAAERLSELAPVVVVAAPERQSEMAGLLAAGAADFVARAGHFPPVAIGLLERRLRNTVPESSEAQQPSGAGSMTLLEMEEDFGEILRHELNNPLTGILGNAELLLAEVRRRNDGRLPLGAQRRLETIADLAVRLRETVRRLSQSWEARQDHVRSA